MVGKMIACHDIVSATGPAKSVRVSLRETRLPVGDAIARGPIAGSDPARVANCGSLQFRGRSRLYLIMA